MDDPILPLPGLSPVSGKRLDVRFDGGLLSSDGGILLLREVEQRLGVADRLAACIKDPRAPVHITRSLADIIGFRLMMIAAGFEDGNDASSLRVDPMFKMALDLAPSGRALCSQPTISRLENLPDTRGRRRRPHAGLGPPARAIVTRQGRDADRRLGRSAAEIERGPLGDAPMPHRLP